MKRLLILGALLTLLPFASSAESRPGWAKPGVAYRVGLLLENDFAGWVDDVRGGPGVGDVIVEKLGGDWLAKKHIGNVKYEEISFKCGTGMSKALYDWIDTGFNQTHNQAGKGRQNGALIFADYDYNEVSRLVFTNAYLSEVGFPALDAASKDAAKMTIRFRPEYTRKQIGGGGKAQGQLGQKAKAWMVNNFRISIDGLGQATQRVSKVDAFTWKQSIVAGGVGESRDYEQEATSVEVPNLVITLAESHAKPLYDWHEDFVIKGNNADEQERGGKLEFLADDQQTVLFTLSLSHLGVFKVAPDKMEAGAEGVRRIKAEMYCEDIRFSYSPASF